MNLSLEELKNVTIILYSNTRTVQIVEFPEINHLLASLTEIMLIHGLLLVFSVTPFKIDQNKKSKPFNRLSLESGNKKKVAMQRLSPRFRSQQFFLWEICGETFSPNL